MDNHCLSPIVEFIGRHANALISAIGTMIAAWVAASAIGRQIAAQDRAARDQRIFELKRDAYLALVKPFVKQQSRLLELSNGLPAGTVSQDESLEPLMAVNLIASADAGIALMKAGRVMLRLTLAHSARTNLNLKPMLEHAEALFEFVIAARRDLGLPDQDPREVRDMFAEHLQKTSHEMARG
jgi:hypothetical protein